MGMLRLMLPLTYVLIDARRMLLEVRSQWYTIMLQLHRFIIAVARVTVNHDGRGGTAPDPLVWDEGGRKKARRTDIRVNIDIATLPGPTGFLGMKWMQVHGGGVAGADIAAWPYSAGIICNFIAFLGTLHWPTGSEDMGHFGVSFWNFLSFSSNGVDIGCSVKRLQGLMLGLTVIFWFPLFLCQREFKFDMVVSSSVVWFELWPSCLVVWVGFCLVVLAHTSSGQGILGGISVLIGLRQGLKNPVIINALRLNGEFWAVPKVQLRSFWMAP